MRVLVAYGSSPDGLVQAISEGLVEAGHSVSVLPAKVIDVSARPAQP